jgi:hypothetical protein
MILDGLDRLLIFKAYNDGSYFVITRCNNSVRNIDVELQLGIGDIQDFSEKVMYFLYTVLNVRTCCLKINRLFGISGIVSPEDPGTTSDMCSPGFTCPPRSVFVELEVCRVRRRCRHTGL